jgi:hypothetical protein
MNLLIFYKLLVKETTDIASSASFLDLYLEFDDSGQLSTKIYDKRDNFNFKIINFPNMCSNIPASPAYGILIKKYFWHFSWLLYLYAFSLYENASLIIVSAETEYISTRSWYRNINEFLPLIYPPELEVKETTDTASSASFLDLYLKFDDSGQLSTKIYNSDSYEYKNKSARRGAQFVPIGMPTTCWNSFPPKETNMLSMRNSSILITCSSE